MNCRNYSRQRLSPLSRMFGVMMIAMLITIGLVLPGATATGPAPRGKQADSAMVAKCKADLAGRLKLQARYIEVSEMKPVIWPDAALGMPETGKVYAQVSTPGLRIILQAKSTRYLYTTSTKAFRYGGPAGIWGYSALYSKPVADEPNLNRDLYQCSLLGTNSIRVVSGVTDYYPQRKGMVIFTRRTSRSGHDLLYVKADGSGKAKPLYSAFDFGAAALNGAQNEWAGFVRPSLGAEWGVVVAPTGKAKANVKTLPLPEGVRPGEIAWSGEKIVILTKKGEQEVCFEISLKAAKPAWKQLGASEFPGRTDFMLNKSETLEIDQVNENGKPGVEVARVWFTGDRKLTARINGLTMRGYDLLGGRYAIVWGEKGSQPAVATVDIATGEVIPSSGDLGRDIKPFLYSVHDSPIAMGEAK